MSFGDMVRIDGEWKQLVCGNNPFYVQQPDEDTIKPIPPNHKPYPYLTNQPQQANNNKHSDNQHSDTTDH